jgi:putative SOS response-associated peptidase YedK
VPVDNFYEWRKTETGKQPYALALADRGIVSLAGLWENCRAGRRTHSLFRQGHHGAERTCAQLHNRMPVILAPEAWLVSAILGSKLRLHLEEMIFCAGGCIRRTCDRL